MLVLALDTSTPMVTAGVAEVREPRELIAALSEGQRPGEGAARPVALVAERCVADRFGHAERLMPLASQALMDAGRRLPDIQAVVAGVGPGPFTGLRVGLATAAALGDALDVAVHGVPSHDATARALVPLSGELLVVTDARRREVYVSGYGVDGRRRIGPLVATPAAVPNLLAAKGITPRWITGSGAGLLDPVRGPGFDPMPLDNNGCIVLGLVECAAKALLTGAVSGPLVPLYLRRPDATPPGARKPVLGR